MKKKYAKITLFLCFFIFIGALKAQTIVIKTDTNGELVNPVDDKVEFTAGQKWADLNGAADAKVKPKNDNFEFDKWVNETTGITTVVYDTTALVADGEYTATFKAKQVTVIFDADGGAAVPAVQTVDKGTAATAPTEVPIKAASETHTYVFKHWVLAEKWESDKETAFDFTTPVISDITLKAVYTATEIEIFIVTFDAGDGTFVVQKINKGGVAVKPEDPVKKADGTDTYVFKQWELNEGIAYDFETPVNENITLKAVYIKNPVTVTFDADNGTEKFVKIITKGEKVDPPAVPVKGPDATNYEFKHWVLAEKWESDKETAYDFTKPVNDNITLKAVYRSVVIVTFDADDGKFVAGDGRFVVQKINKGEKVVLPAEVPVKKTDGTNTYLFKQWELNEGSAYDFALPVNENITLKAVYTATVTALNAATAAALNVTAGPNPFSNLITVSAKGEFKVRLYNLLGQEMMPASVANGTTVLQVSNLTAGVYLLNVETEKGMTSIRLIKK